MPAKRPTLFEFNYWAPLALFLLIDLLLIREAFWFRENIHGIRFIVNYALSFLGLASFLYLVRLLLNRNWPLRIAGAILIAIPLMTQLSYFSVYKKFIPPFGFAFFGQDPKLTLSLSAENFPLLKAVVLFLAMIFALSLLYSVPRRIRPLRVILPAILFSGILIHSVFGWYSVNEFGHSILSFYSALLDNGLRNSRAFKTDRPAVPVKKRESRSAPAEIIWIIGESTCITHMSLYGYGRPTTPFLDSLRLQKAIVPFRNAVSIGNKTNLSVPYMLTGLEGPDPAGFFYRAPTVFAYAKAAGYATAFLTAQDFRWGHLDKILIDRSVDEFIDGSALSSSVDVLEGIDDSLLLGKLAGPYLDTIASPFLLVLQMNGSHYPYSRHCPQRYKKFLPETGENSIEAYDNTIVYTDLFLSKLYQKARSRFPDCWIIFSPDHGQNLGGTGGLYNDSYLSDVVHNPLIIMPPSKSGALLEANIDAPVSQADIAATILDIMDIPPVAPVNGLSLLKPIPAGRLRTCSEYMPTFHNNPSAVLFLPDFRYYKIDFTKSSALLPDGKTIIPYSTLSDTIRNYIDKRLKR